MQSPRIFQENSQILTGHRLSPRGIRLRLLLLRAGKELPMEEQQVERAHGHAGISEVEHRAEEDHPSPVAYYGEVEHVHHSAEHERSIVPNQSVEQAVDDIAYRPGSDHRKPDKHPDGSPALAQQGVYPPYQEAAEHDAEQRQQQLARSVAERQAEGHALVLHEAQTAPLAYQRNLLAERHIRLDQNLDDLVNDDEQNTQHQEPGSFGQFHTDYFLPVLAIISLASTVRVA